MAGVAVAALVCFIEGGLFAASPSRKALSNRCVVAVRIAEPDTVDLQDDNRPLVGELRQVELGEFAAGGDTGLGEDVAQVERDGPVRHPALGGDVLVRQP